MQIQPQDEYLNCVCQHRVDGVKYNRGKFSIRHGTFDNTRLSVQNILWTTEKECKQYIGQKNDKTVVKWYGHCNTIANDRIRKHPPKLGGYGKL